MSLNEDKFKVLLKSRDRRAGAPKTEYVDVEANNRNHAAELAARGNHHTAIHKIWNMSSKEGQAAHTKHRTATFTVSEGSTAVIRMQRSHERQMEIIHKLAKALHDRPWKIARAKTDAGRKRVEGQIKKLADESNRRSAVTQRQLARIKEDKEMKSFGEFMSLVEGRWDQIRATRSRAILPTGSKLDTHKPDSNEFHKGWYGDGKYKGHYTLLKRRTPSNKHEDGYEKVSHVVINGKHEPGEKFVGHHDQNFRHLGDFEAVKTVEHDKTHHLPKGKYPLYVYK